MAGKKLDPEHEAAAAEAAAFMRNWDGPGRVHPHVVAHRDPDTKLLTYVVRFLPDQLPYVLASVSGPIPDDLDEQAAALVATWTGPADVDLPTAAVDRDNDPLSVVTRFSPKQFLFLKAMVGAY